MKLDIFSLRLPLSLLVTSLSLVAIARPVELKSLHPEDFQDSIAHGTWLIEHFSPYCHHCRDFAPTWTELVEDTEGKADPGIQLAQVNCAVHGDLCDANNVKGYPQINLYRDGEFVEQFRETRDLDTLKAYIEKHARPTSVASSEPTPTTLTEEAPTQAYPAYPLRIQTSRADVNPSGTVLSLDPVSFKDVVDSGPVFVKFFAPWCGHCRKLAPTWTQLARHMQHKLNIAEVNCEDYKSFCSSQGVPGFPMLAYYTNGVQSEYTGSRKFDQLKAFAETASAPAMQDLGDQKLEDLVKANDVVYVLSHNAADTSTLDAMHQASGVLLGSPPVYSTSSDDIARQFLLSGPAVMVFKDGDFDVPYAIQRLPAATSSIKDWLLANRLPSSIELTQDTFQQVMNAPHKPLVILAPTNKDTEKKVGEKMRELGKKWRIRKGERGIDRDAVFAWMDSERWAKWLKSMYGIKGELTGETPVVIADHGKLVYYEADAQGSSLKLVSTTLFPAIEGAVKGSLRAKHSENMLERLARYLNDTVQGFESYLINHPWHIAMFLVGFVVFFIIIVRRAMTDDVEQIRGHRNGHVKKSNRLD